MRLSVFLSFLFFLSTAQALPSVQALNRNSQKIDVSFEDSLSNRPKSTTLNYKGTPHNVKVYTKRQIEFMAVMLATEIWYCYKDNLADFTITLQEETPSCWNEITQMVTSPGMHVGILALTMTSIGISNKGEKILKKYLRKLKNVTRAEQLAEVGMFAIQHLGIGIGMISQNIVTSVMDTKSLRDCAKEIIANPQEDPFSSSFCKDAATAFVNGEYGTWSEIQIGTLSLGISVAATGAIVGGLRVVGMAVGMMGPTGFIVRVGTVASYTMIDFFDRYIEKYVRQWYHELRSKNRLLESFENLIAVTKRENPFEARVCTKKAPRVSRCLKYENFDPSEKFLKKYSEEISYRRRATLNIFSEAQARWKQKYSNLITTIRQYHEFLRLIYILREERKSPEVVLDKNYTINPFYFLDYGKVIRKNAMNIYRETINTYQETSDEDSEDDPTPIKTQYDLDSSDQNLSLYGEISKEQMNTLDELINDVDNYTDSTPLGLKEKLIAIKSGLEAQDLSKTRILIWELKLQMSMAINAMSINDGFYGKFRNFISWFTELDPYKLYALDYINQKTLYTPAQNITPVFDTDSVNIVQYGLYRSLEKLGLKESAGEYLVKTNLNDAFSTMLNYSVCNQNPEVQVYYSNGLEAKLNLPRLVADYGYTCDQILKPLPFYAYNYQCGVGIKTDQERKALLVSKNKCDIVNHGIFQYEGKEYLGLLELLTDPDIPLVFGDSIEEAQLYWSENITKQILQIFSDSQKLYFTLLESEFRLFSKQNSRLTSDPGKDEFYCPNQGCNNRKKVKYNSVLTDEEVEQRDHSSYFRNTIYAGESFAEEARTYHYLIKKLIPENQSLIRFLESYIKSVDNLVRLLQNKVDLEEKNNRTCSKKEFRVEFLTAGNKCVEWKDDFSYTIIQKFGSDPKDDDNYVELENQAEIKKFFKKFDTSVYSFYTDNFEEFDTEFTKLFGKLDKGIKYYSSLEPSYKQKLSLNVLETLKKSLTEDLNSKINQDFIRASQIMGFENDTDVKL